MRKFFDSGGHATPNNFGFMKIIGHAHDYGPGIGHMHDYGPATTGH